MELLPGYFRQRYAHCDKGQYQGPTTYVIDVVSSGILRNIARPPSVESQVGYSSGYLCTSAKGLFLIRAMCKVMGQRRL